MAEDLRVETNRIPECMSPKPNITEEEAKVLKELRQDKDRVILTVDKGMALVVLDKQDYIKPWTSWWIGTLIDH